jgi:hypothetical protein
LTARLSISTCTGILKIILIKDKGGHGFSFLECQNQFSRALFTNAEGFLQIVLVFGETGSVTHKKGAGRPMVRTEEIVTRNKLRLTFSNP